MNWKTKTFISFLTTLGFLTMSITGLVIYFVPQGQIAFWIDWRFLGLSKSDWGDIHIATSFLFIVAGLFHIYYNWRVLLSYVRERSSGMIRSLPEMGVTAAITLFVILGAMYRIPPVQQILAINNYFHEKHWVKSPLYKPPMGHAEILTLKKFTMRMNLNLDEAMGLLVDAGWKGVSSDLTLEAIARANGKSPMELYAVIQKETNHPMGKQKKESEGK